jgi:hypothetical protein
MAMLSTQIPVPSGEYVCAMHRSVAAQRGVAIEQIRRQVRSPRPPQKRPAAQSSATAQSSPASAAPARRHSVAPARRRLRSARSRRTSSPSSSTRARTRPRSSFPHESKPGQARRHRALRRASPRPAAQSPLHTWAPRCSRCSEGRRRTPSSPLPAGHTRWRRGPPRRRAERHPSQPHRVGVPCPLG